MDGVGGGGISVAAVSGVGGTGAEGVAGVVRLLLGLLERLGGASEGMLCVVCATNAETSSDVLMVNIVSSELAAVTLLFSSESIS